MAISAQERAQLVTLAQQAVGATVRGEPLPQPEGLSGVLAQQRGCFVTLTNKGSLRGCIGTFSPDRPLGQMIVAMGAAAARDPRFTLDPISPQELDELDLEVSVLSELELTAQPDKLEVGRHGIYVVGRGRAGCFLPEVATDQGWTAAQFLDYCCVSKAGLPAGAWRDPAVKVFLFTSEKFDG